jgi:hypothetical protein
LIIKDDFTTTQELIVEFNDHDDEDEDDDENDKDQNNQPSIEMNDDESLNRETSEHCFYM